MLNQLASFVLTGAVSVTGAGGYSAYHHYHHFTTPPTPIVQTTPYIQADPPYGTAPHDGTGRHAAQRWNGYQWVAKPGRINPQNRAITGTGGYTTAPRPLCSKWADQYVYKNGQWLSWSDYYKCTPNSEHGNLSSSSY